MENYDYKSNSHRSREERREAAAAERKPLEKAIKGTAKVKKKNEIRKLTDIFISEDAANVKSYIIMDVLIPAAKKAISDIVTNGIDMILYGETGHSKRHTASGTISYNKYYDDKSSRRDYSTRTRTGYSYDDIVVETRREAEEVIDQLKDVIDTYGMASVADLYDLVGITGNYTDNKYGWTNLRNAEPFHVRDGYLLRLPKAIPIE